MEVFKKSEKFLTRVGVINLSQERGGLEREDFLEYFPHHIKGFVDLTLCGLDKVECFGQISIAA